MHGRMNVKVTIFLNYYIEITETNLLPLIRVCLLYENKHFVRFIKCKPVAISVAGCNICKPVEISVSRLQYL